MRLKDIISEGLLDGRRCQAAVFAIEHIPSGRRLIVATTNLSKRLCDQARYLRQRRHHNPAVQADLLASGPDSFKFVLLATVANSRELKYLKRLHVEVTREQGNTYHAEEPPNRKLLLRSSQGKPATSASESPNNPSAELTLTLKRLDDFNMNLMAHPELTKAWTDLMPLGSQQAPPRCP